MYLLYLALHQKEKHTFLPTKKYISIQFIYVHITDQAVSTSCLFFSLFSIVSLFIPPLRASGGAITPFTPLNTPLVGRVVGRGGRAEAWWKGHILKEPASVLAFFRGFKIQPNVLDPDPDVKTGSGFGSGSREI